MNSALLVANAVALAVLLGFSFFSPKNDAAMIAQRIPHYLQLQKNIAVGSHERSTRFCQPRGEPGDCSAAYTVF